MNVIVKAPLKTNDIQQLIDGTTSEGYTFTLLERAGISMEFEVKAEDGAIKDPVDVVKAIIRSTPYGSALYFSVVKK